MDSKYEALKGPTKKPAIKMGNDSSKTPSQKCYKNPSSETNICAKKNVQIYACGSPKPTTVTTSKGIKSTKIVNTTKTNFDKNHFRKGNVTNITMTDEWQSQSADKTMIRKTLFDTGKEMSKAAIKVSEKAFSNGKIYFYIKPNTLYLGNTYKITAKVKKGDYNVKAVLFIKVKQALKGKGYCEVKTSVSFGQELEDKFTIKCLNFQGQVCNTKLFFSVKNV